MKGGNSALGRRLMDVAILVACSHTDCLLFMFFWSVFCHKYVQTKAGTAAVWGRRLASSSSAQTAVSCQHTELSFNLE